MGLATFIGGIHPYEGKELSENQPIEVLMPKGELVYPLSQHIGAPAKPLVKKGDQVLVGQRIGEAGGFVSAHVISSVSGVEFVQPVVAVLAASIPEAATYVFLLVFTGDLVCSLRFLRVTGDLKGMRAAVFSPD